LSDVDEKLPSAMMRKSDPGVTMQDGMELKIRLS